MRARCAALVAAITIAGALLLPRAACAQDPAAPPPAGSAATVALSAADLEKLVGPIALYPDDLVAIILPASTYPLEVVKAQRFLEKRKADASLQPDAGMPEPVRNLLNYPEVVKKMNDDLDWVQALGEAMVSQQAAVMDAVQAFRRKASAAGNLKTDDKQMVVVEKEVVKIVPADPQVIYVPQYEPSSVVVQYAPSYYYPTPYPVYYYPYPPGAVFASAVFFGAMTAWAVNWGGNHVEHNVDIDRTSNININRDNPQRQEAANRAKEAAAQRPKASATTAGGGAAAQTWRSEKQPGQVRSGAVQQPRAATRPGDAQFGGTDGIARADSRPAATDRSAGGRQPSAGDLGAGGDAFGGVGASASSTARASDRGAASRASASQRASAGVQRSAGAASRPSGGARAGGGARRR
jgi:hypothetical protein